MLKIYFVLENSADPDEMLHYEAFHLGRHCLQRYWFKAAKFVTFDLMIF